MRRPLAVVALVAVASTFVLTRARGQVITIPNPLTTTTVTQPPPSTTAPPITTTTEPPAVLPGDDTVTTLPTDTTLPVPVPVEPTPAVTTPTPPRVVARPTQVALPAGLRAASLTGAYGLGLGGVLTVALLLVMFTTIARAQLIPGGSLMNARRRARLITGIACLALAAIVGLVGYLKLSLEPDINRQIPYLASAGMALVLLAAVGGALIVGEQMRTDQQRIEQLEAAVEQLASIVAPTVEAPPRTRARRS